MNRTVARRVTVALSVFATLFLIQGAASATPAPSRVDRAVTLASPGVVFIDTSVSVHGRLTYQNPSAISGLASIDHTYTFDFATGSGFVVTPDGVVVTASHVVEPDPQEIKNYAANELVLRGYGYNYPAGGSPFGTYTLPITSRNQLLQQCYQSVACSFDITPIITVYSAVDVAQGQLPKGTPARILTSTGFNNTDIAVLRVNGTNMPTVALGNTASNLNSGDSVVALGFPGTSRDALQTGVTQPNKVFGHVSNIRPQGTSNLIEIDASIEPGESGGPVIDDSGRVVGLVSFSLVQASGQASGAKYLRTIDDIRAALSSAGVKPSRGPVDSAFQRAMTLYWGNHFTAAAPALQRVLDVSPGHPLATQYLAVAQSKAGTKADVPVSSPSSGFPVWIIALIAAAVVAGVILFLLNRRRKKPEPVPAVSAVGPAPSVAAVAGSEAERSVGFRPSPAAVSPTAPAPPSETDMAAPVGENYVAPQVCSNCGHALNTDARFCSSCGQTVRA